MKNKIEDLRNHLFETLERLNDKDEPMDLDRARAVANIASVVIESAKAETDRLKAVGDLGLTFGGDFINDVPRLVNGKAVDGVARGKGNGS